MGEDDSDLAKMEIDGLGGRLDSTVACSVISCSAGMNVLCWNSWESEEDSGLDGKGSFSTLLSSLICFSPSESSAQLLFQLDDSF